MTKLNAPELIAVFKHYSWRRVRFLEHDFNPTGAELDNAIEAMQALLDEIGRYRAVIEAAQIWERDENRTDETEHNLIMAVQALSAYAHDPSECGYQIESSAESGRARIDSEFGDLEFVHALRHGDIEDIPPMRNDIADRLESLSTEYSDLKLAVENLLCYPNGEAERAAVENLVSGKRAQTKQCDHVWVNAENAVIKSGFWCEKCNAIFGGDPAQIRREETK
jgi:hypothetical protein